MKMMENLYVVEQLARERFAEEIELAEQHRRTKAAEHTGFRTPNPGRRAQEFGRKAYTGGKVVARAPGTGEVPGL